MKKRFSRILFLSLLAVFATSIFGQQGTLNVVDSSFAPEVESQNYSNKTVTQVQAFPDGKIVAIGSFNSFNRVPVGKVVRLNADGSLDSTFNTQTVTSLDAGDIRARIILQPDGKIVISCRDIVANGQPPNFLVRLNADGTLDTGFNYTLGAAVERIEVDSVGRLSLAGSGFPTPLGTRPIVRLNGNGSLDSSFNYAASQQTNPYIAMQGNRLIVGDTRIFRLNENGSEDSSFTQQPSVASIRALLVQPDNKILYLGTNFLRLNENGGVDSSMQSPTISVNGIAVVRIASDGKIVVTSMSSAATVRQFLPTGAEDPAFPEYQTVGMAFGSITIQPDGKIIIGDRSNLNVAIPLNNFVRLNFNGTPDPTFNPGGIGFQFILPGSIRAIAVQPDGKIVLGGKIDVVNDVVRYRLARVNADGTVDTSFQVNTSATGDRFSIIRDIYQIRAQSDGKVVVSGWFDYVQGGVSKRNLVRLNSDGSMDPTFSLNELVNDYSEIVGAGRNRFLTLNDGKLLVGISKNGFDAVGPWKYMPDGSRDASFNSMLNTASAQMFIDDVVIQPDGKFVVSGSHRSAIGGDMKSYVARLNADGSVDPTFTYSEEPTRLRSLLTVLADGKILVSKHSVSGTIVGKVERLNADGTPDPSFNSVSIPGTINALQSLQNGKFFVGGNFTVTVNGQVRRNLLQFRADGTFDPTSYNVNSEVLCLTLDAEGRLLVGGSFTVIGANNATGANRSYIARLTSTTDFDYDGDGKADISVFRPSENTWYVLRSSNWGLIQQTFAIAGDIPAPADYDGDGKTDMAIYRPSSGDWWYLSSINNAQITGHWGQAGDIPRPSDFDGDGKADFVLYRPSNNVWYRWGSAGSVTITEFGIAEDKPLVGDFDGDGKSDLAVFRPSTGDWWYAASASGGQFIRGHWGQTGDIPVPADYDGDGKTDVAVFRPSEGGWYIYNSGSGSFTILAFGTNEDRPVAADYDGDGRADIAVFRPSTGIWHLLQSTAGSSGAQWGIATDSPTQGSFIP